jgi:branched-chain amino acid transport system substrate-binding protein
VHILRQCGDDLTRENVMRQATNIKGYVPSLALPGMSLNTTANDYRINKQMQMMRFNGERWELFGTIIEDTGPAG